ncbi:hypothetical protein KE407_001524, partial [Campylobacter lari]|nr:hypothetical protein [Campylobacter lari]
RIDKKKTLKELTEDMVKIWGNYIDYDTTRKIFGAKIFKEYPRLWSKIKFSPRIQEIIKLSNNTAKEAFDNSFIAIHIRSGDIVYDERIRKLGVGFGKAMPVEIAMELIEKNKKENKNIVLFGDDLSELRALKQYYHVSIIEDFIHELTGIDRIIFEINFMSKAEVIYSGGSSFARVASYIGLGKEPTFYQNVFSNDEIIKILTKQNSMLKFHKLQKFYSLIHRAILQIQSDKCKYSILDVLDNAKKLDCGVSDGLCGVLTFYCLLKKEDWIFLEDIFIKYPEYTNLVFNLKYGIFGREVVKLFFIYEYNFKCNKIKKFIALLKIEFFIEYYTLLYS